METSANPDDSRTEGTSRRFFLGAAAGLTGAALAAAAARGEADAVVIPPAAVSGFTSAGFNLLIDGAQAGSLQTATGGSASSDVVLEKLGADHVVHKHLAGVKYEDFALQPSFPISAPLAAEITSMFALKLDPFGGSVQEFNSGLKLLVERQFTNALVSEVGFPACDASSKDPGFLTVGISPETTTRVPSPRGTVPTKTKSKVFVSSNFKLAIDNLNTTGVTKIDAFTVKLAIDPGTINRGDAPPAFLDVGDLKITLTESSARTWFDWFQDFVINGNNGDDAERNGTLTLLTSDLKLALATISFSHLGIFALDSTPDTGHTRQVTAQLYCEQMKLALAKI